MARQARGNILAGTYHVTMRSAGPISMFVDDYDRTLFCMLLARTIKNHKWTCRAFCLMTTHYHLLVDVEDNALQPGMQSLNGPYAQRFNGRHRRSGHLRGDRYYAVQVESDGHMLQLLRYLARNPVEAGLCEQPSDWPWSSYRGCADLDGGFAFVDSEPLRVYFGEDRPTATRRLRRFVDDAAQPA
jgi:REP element-mobilizing transposase RayT